MLTRLTQEVSSRPVGLTRTMVGAASAARALIALPVLLKLAEPATLKAPYFDWMPEPSTQLAWALIGVWTLAGVLFSAGWRVPISGLTLLAAIVFFLGLDRQTYGNHVYLMAWLVLLLIVADAGVGMALGKPDRPVLRWPMILLMAQASVVYGFAGLTKLHADFLSGRILAGVLNDGPIQFPEALRTPTFLSVLAATAVFIELFLALFLWFPRFRHAAFLLGFFLHGGIILFMSATGELIVFASMMLSLYPLFLIGSVTEIRLGPLDGIRDMVDRLRRFDVLHLTVLANQPANDGRVLEASTTDSETHDYDATVMIRERLVPHLWFSSLMRLPGLRAIGRSRFARRIG